jgi:hypothetical protein
MARDHFAKHMMSPHFHGYQHTRHSDGARPDLDMEAKIEGFLKRIICTLTFHKFFKS